MGVYNFALNAVNLNQLRLDPKCGERSFRSRAAERHFSPVGGRFDLSHVMQRCLCKKEEKVVTLENISRSQSVIRVKGVLDFP